jgi:hypothetical protein
MFMAIQASVEIGRRPAERTGMWMAVAAMIAGVFGMLGMLGMLGDAVSLWRHYGGTRSEAVKDWFR